MDVHYWYCHIGKNSLLMCILNPPTKLMNSTNLRTSTIKRLGKQICNLYVTKWVFTVYRFPSPSFNTSFNVKAYCTWFEELTCQDWPGRWLKIWEGIQECSNYYVSEEEENQFQQEHFFCSPAESDNLCLWLHPVPHSTYSYMTYQLIWQCSH